MSNHHPPKEKLRGSGNKFGDISTVKYLPSQSVGVIHETPIPTQARNT